jgi:hypothetical protein
MSSDTRATTVVNHPPRFSISFASARLSRSHASWTASSGMTGPIAYWHVDDINKSLEALFNAGAEADQAIQDVGGGTLIATVKDADGNATGLVQAPAGG